MARKAMTTTLNIRDIHASAARAIKGGADELGLSLGQYLHRLALLLLASRERARADEETARTLQNLGLVPPPPVPENWQAPRLTAHPASTTSAPPLTAPFGPASAPREAWPVHGPGQAIEVGPIRARRRAKRESADPR
jgi:hypothetical protein